MNAVNSKQNLSGSAHFALLCCFCLPWDWNGAGICRNGLVDNEGKEKADPSTRPQKTRPAGDDNHVPARARCDSSHFLAEDSPIPTKSGAWEPTVSFPPFVREKGSVIVSETGNRDTFCARLPLKWPERRLAVWCPRRLAYGIPRSDHQKWNAGAGRRKLPHGGRYQGWKSGGAGA